MSSQEFSEWMAYAQIEPFGEERADLRMAILAALIANVNRDPKKTKEFKPQDFIPKFEQDEPRSPEDVAARVDAIFSALASTEKR